MNDNDQYGHGSTFTKVDVDSGYKSDDVFDRPSAQLDDLLAPFVNSVITPMEANAASVMMFTKSDALTERLFTSCNDNAPALTEEEREALWASTPTSQQARTRQLLGLAPEMAWQALLSPIDIRNDQHHLLVSQEPAMTVLSLKARPAIYPEFNFDEELRKAAYRNRHPRKETRLVKILAAKAPRVKRKSKTRSK